MPTRLAHRRPPGEAPPTAIGARAEADLAFVRAAMERSATFTAVPGVGGMLMGATAVVAAVVAHAQATNNAWLLTWLADAMLAGTIGAVALVRKARRSQLPLAVGPARRFALGLAPALIAGAALTIGCVNMGAWQLLPPAWMLCYGVAVLGAGAVSSVRVVPIVGSVFVAAGVLAVATPVGWADWWLGATFGGVHLVAGWIVARRHGG